MTKLAFVDTETTGLDPDLHEIWEAAVIVREENGEEHEHKWFLPVDLGRADPFALSIGRFHERYGYWPARTIVKDGEEVEIPEKHGQVSSIRRFAAQFAKHTRGAHLVGAVTSFDEERLRRLLKANGACPEWHYHLVDVENLVAGRLGIQPPWDSKELSRAAGIDPDAYEAHTALGDALWAKALYDAVAELVRSETAELAELKSDLSDRDEALADAHDGFHRIKDAAKSGFGAAESTPFAGRDDLIRERFKDVLDVCGEA